MHTALLSRFDLIMFVENNISFEERFDYEMSNLEDNHIFNTNYYNRMI